LPTLINLIIILNHHNEFRMMKILKLRKWKLKLNKLKSTIHISRFTSLKILNKKDWSYHW